MYPSSISKHVPLTVSQKRRFTSHASLPASRLRRSNPARQRQLNSFPQQRIGSILLDSAWQSVVIAFPSFSVITSLLFFLELIKSSSSFSSCTFPASLPASPLRCPWSAGETPKAESACCDESCPAPDTLPARLVNSPLRLFLQGALFPGLCLPP